jgi:hypothetical protein
MVPLVGVPIAGVKQLPTANELDASAMFDVTGRHGEEPSPVFDA